MEKNKVTSQSDDSRTSLCKNNSSNKRNDFAKFPQFLGAVLATLSATSMGLCFTWTSPALVFLNKSDSKINITLDQFSWVASLIALGAILGALPTGYIANLVGRKRTLQIIAVPLFIPWLMIAYSGGVYGLYAARFLVGIAMGATCVATPMYVAEIAHVSIRGTLGTLFQVQVTIGLLLEDVLGEIVGDFRSLALVSAVVPLVFLTGITFMPETPVYLLTKGEVAEARKSLTYFRGAAFDIDDELARIGENIKEATGDDKAKITDLITSRSTLIALIISLGLMIFQQISGINAVLAYTSAIFENSGITSMSPGLCSIIVATVQFLATLVSTALIDRAGRKILLLISASVMSICLITLGIYFHLELKQYHDLPLLSIVPLICLAVFVVMFSIGLGPIPWIMVSEIFAPRTKGIASSISAATNWILAFVVTKFFPDLNAALGIGITFIAFGVFCALGAVFVACIVPETKGKDIVEIQKMLRGEAVPISDKKKSTNSAAETQV